MLDAWIGGDAASAKLLFERYFDPLYGFFRSKVSVAVDDLVQDTFVELLRGRNKFREVANFRAYLFGTARNLLFKELRARHQGTRVVALGEASVEALDPSPSGVMVHSEQERILCRALRRIPLDDQILFELYEWEQMPAKDVGIVLGISEGAVRSRLQRAKARLRDEIQAVASSPDLFRSTIEGFEAWASALRGALRPGQR